jgi:hypothetical protein
MAVYLDSSALVKLVVRERESSALRRPQRYDCHRFSCEGHDFDFVSRGSNMAGHDKTEQHTRVLPCRGIVHRAPAEHGAQDAGGGQRVEVAGERIAIDDDEIGVIARAQPADALPAQHPCGVARPHLQRFGACDRLPRSEILPPTAAETMRLCQRDVLENVLRSPICAAPHNQAGIEHAAQRNEVAQHLRPDALDEHVALAPGERHAGGDVKAEGRVAARLLRVEEEDMLQDPATKEKGDRLLCRGSILEISEVYASKSSLSPFFLAFRGRFREDPLKDPDAPPMA